MFFFSPTHTGNPTFNEKVTTHPYLLHISLSVKFQTHFIHLFTQINQADATFKQERTQEFLQYKSPTIQIH